ncbi:MAG TPA: GNAT family N-acetyltransferase [Chitinophagaceae bacterium]|jgi:RimJ/RimL family protein N-acetyltransferase
MYLIPINERIEDNKHFVDDPLCRETIYLTIDFFKKVGYKIPWIGYYAKQNKILVGSAAFKGPPNNGVVEIAYGTFEPYRQKGIGTEICKLLVELALKTDPAIKITARTLPQKNFSTRILEKNEFEFSGIVNDPEDGDVWEWVYKKKKS